MTGDLVRASDQFAIIEPAMQLADRIAKTDFVPAALKGKPEAVLAAILTGNELGLPPMTAINKIHVIEGRPSLAAELMRALVQSAGHEIWLEDSNSTKATIGGRRNGDKNASYITWTMDDADKAGLKGKNNWKKYPRAMLVARATSELCRFLFADVLAGISYSVEELEDGFDLEDQEPAEPSMNGRPDGAPAPKKPTSKRSRKKPPAEGDDTQSKVEQEAPGLTGSTASRGAQPPPPLPGEDGYDDVTGTVTPDGVLDAESEEVEPVKTRFHNKVRELTSNDGEQEARALRHAVIYMATNGATVNSQEADYDALEAACEVLTQVEEGTWRVDENERLVAAEPTFEWGGQHSGTPEDDDPLVVLRDAIAEVPNLGEARVLKRARRIAEDNGWPAPATFDEIEGDVLAVVMAEVLAKLDELS